MTAQTGQTTPTAFSMAGRKVGKWGKTASGWKLLLHRFGAFDAEQGERRDEFAQCDCGRGEEEGLARGVLFREDVVAMVEVGKLLRELEGVLGEIGGFGRADALIQNLRKTSGPQP